MIEVVDSVRNNKPHKTSVICMAYTA